MSDSNTNSQEFRSDNIELKLVKEPGCQVTMDIIVTPKATEAAYQKAVKVVNKEISFPGFRKGHAPLAIVEQKFGNYINDEWKKILAETSFSEALTLCKIFPRTDKSIKSFDVKNISRQEGSLVNIVYENQPEVPEVNLEGFSLHKLDLPPVDEEKIEDALYNLRLEKGTYEAAEERPAQDGDFVMVDIDALVGPEKKPIKVTEGGIFEVGSVHSPAWLSNLTRGLKAGESADGEVECKADDHAGHDHARRVTVLEIKTGQIAPINEELLKSTGCDSEDALRSQIKMHLENNRERHLEEDKIRQVENYIRDQYDFDVPKSMYEKPAKEFAQRQIALLKQEEGVQEDFAMKAEAIKLNSENELKGSLRLFLISDHIARQKNIQVSENDVYIENIREMMQTGRKGEMDEQSMSRMYVKVLQKKVMEQLVHSIES